MECYETYSMLAILIDAFHTSQTFDLSVEMPSPSYIFLDTFHLKTVARTEAQQTSGHLLHL